MKVPGARPHLGVEPRHGLEVVVEDVGPRPRRRCRAPRPCAGNRGSRPRSSSPARRRGSPRSCARTDEGAAVVEIVAIDRGDDDMREARRRDRRGDALGLVRVEPVRAGRSRRCRRCRRRCTRARGSSPSHARASSIRRYSGRPASSHTVLRLELAHQPPRLVIFRRARRLDPDPGRLFQDRRCREGAPFPGGAQRIFWLPGERSSRHSPGPAGGVSRGIPSPPASVGGEGKKMRLAHRS